MGRRAGIVSYMAGTVLLVLIAALFAGCTAMSRTDIGTRELEEYYLTKEQALTKDVRELLAVKGYENSGVMVTRVIEDDGSRLYTIAVHHKRIDLLDDKERQMLLSQVENLVFDDEACSFFIDFF